jgi:hypothetical protein
MYRPRSSEREESERPRVVAAPIAVAHGDGIGPEIMAASLRVSRAAGARLAIEAIAVGQTTEHLFALDREPGFSLGQGQ